MNRGINILITGVQYHTDDVTGVLGRMLRDRVSVVLLKTTSAKYGVVVEARERYGGKTFMRGFVSRVDLPVVLQLMEDKAHGVLLAKVKSVNMDGGYFCVCIDVPESFAVRQMITDKVWDEWELTSCQMIDMTDEMVRADEAFTLLETALQCPGMFEDEYITENLDQLIDSTRYDVSREAEDALVWCRRMVVDYPSFSVQAYLDKLTHAINGLGSQNRQKEFVEVYLDRLYDSEQMRQMLQVWYEGLGVRARDEGVMKEVMMTLLDGITNDLQSLPDGLCKDAFDFGMLMHRLVYKPISRRMLLMILSAVMMRMHLLNELEDMFSESLVEQEKEAFDDQIETRRNDTAFGFIIYRQHPKAEIDDQMESLRVKCQGRNSRALVRMLNDLDKEGFIDISDVSAAELYSELDRVFGLPNIRQRAFSESYRLIG